MTEATKEIEIDLGPRFPGTITLTEQAFTCDNCGRLNVMSHASQSDGASYGLTSTYNSRTHWIPKHGESREFPDVPEHIAGGASEATFCLSVGAYRAVGSLARAVVEATAKEKGITKGRLVEKIDQMYSQHLLREHIKDAAHEVRYFGNDMAHGDFIDPVTEEEAAEAVTLMSEVLEEVFQSPARVVRAREAREAKNQGGS